ncbi:anti-sigma factor family protein [Corallococcus sicarius]|uniref:Zf-HC2 domain-containing protein n=1 Tax=Corallococcus sicarius TaxID=2316726 RepID=A0A3A8N4J9_9BACT|nr:zf-HC2 domain-containing protein [Corallococcus sicarius]RKH34164.1 zf-HC2 domain-containing protein [Corallococcus sicarius]
MSAQNAHAHEDRLLDFAYGELPPSEAQTLEQHVHGCARCSKALADIRGVRSTMAHLSVEPAPDAGLESLLAYAQQSARRAAAGPEPKPSRWRRWLLPAVGLATVSTFGIVTLEASKGLKLEPQLSQKVAAPREEALKAKKDGYASVEAQAMPPAPAAAIPPAEEEVMAAAPQVVPMDERKAAPAPKMRGADNRPSDWMNAGSGGAMLERRSAGSLGAKKKMPSFKQQEAEEVLAGAPALTELKADSAERAKEAPSAVASLDRDSPISDKASKLEEGASLRLGGSSSYGRGASADDESFAEGDMPPPPPPPPSASAPVAQAPAPSAPATNSVRREQAAPGKGAAAAEPSPQAGPMGAARPAPLEKSARADAMTSRDLARQAQDAAVQGDRARESQLLRAALAAGARGSERLSLLSRLCESQYAQGRSAGAAEVCGQIISEAPGSDAAQVAQRRLRQLAPAKAQ